MLKGVKELNDELQLKCDELEELKIIKDKYETIKIDNKSSNILNNQIAEYKEKLVVIEKKIIDFEHNKNNNSINEEINKLEDKITIEENKTYNRYTEYLELTADITKYEKELSNLNLEKEKLNSSISKNTEYLTKNNYILEKINKNEDMYVKFCEIKKNLDTLTKKYEKIEDRYNDLDKEISETDEKNKQLNDKCIVAKSIIKKHTGTIEDINDFNLFVNILNNNGLCDKILKEQIIVNLQKSLDNICGYIGHEKINIIIESLPNNKMKKYNIIINTDKIKDISNAGGFQSNIMELLFKLAFLSINNYFTSDFIIIDEIFDACSQENKFMAIKLVEYFKTQYKKILLVSHNQDIINLFDHRIVIKKDEINGNSILQA